MTFKEIMQGLSDGELRAVLANLTEMFTIGAVGDGAFRDLIRRVCEETGGAYNYSQAMVERGAPLEAAGRWVKMLEQADKVFLRKSESVWADGTGRKIIWEAGGWGLYDTGGIQIAFDRCLEDLSEENGLEIGT